MDNLCLIAKKNKLSIISDAAQAYGAFSKRRKIGTLGDASCFSLGPGKAVAEGEGGVMVTNNEALYERAIAISQHPLRAFREIVQESDLPFQDEMSWNYRIHPLAAVLALANLKVASKMVAHRRFILKTVQHEFKSISYIKPIYCYREDSSVAYGIYTLDL